MFDFGFSEIALILILGLIVLGPEKLPVAFKTISQWLKMFRELSQGVKTTLSQELKMHEMQDELQKLGELTKSQLYTEDKQVLRQEVEALKSTILQLQAELSALTEQKGLNTEAKTISETQNSLTEIEHDEDLLYHAELTQTARYNKNCHPPRMTDEQKTSDKIEAVE